MNERIRLLGLTGLIFCNACVFDTGPDIPFAQPIDQGGDLSQPWDMPTEFDAERTDVKLDADAAEDMGRSCEDRCMRQGEVSCAPTQRGRYATCERSAEGCLAPVIRICPEGQRCDIDSDTSCSCPPSCVTPGAERCVGQRYQVCDFVGECLIWRDGDCPVPCADNSCPD